MHLKNDLRFFFNEFDCVASLADFLWASQRVPSGILLTSKVPVPLCVRTRKEQPRSQGSLLLVPTELERKETRGSREKLIPRKGSFVSHFFFVWFVFNVHTIAHNDRTSKIDLLSLQL